MIYRMSISIADDTNIFVNGNNVNSIYSKANQKLENIDTWMVVNKLFININKTVHMLFRTSSRKTVKQNKTLIRAL